VVGSLPLGLAAILKTTTDPVHRFPPYKTRGFRMIANHGPIRSIGSGAGQEGFSLSGSGVGFGSKS
jgi:hypothetical protein